MPRFFFKKQHQVEALIYEYLEHLETSKKHFAEAINTCLETGVCDNFDFRTRLTHKFESKADDVREKIKEFKTKTARIGKTIMIMMCQKSCIDGIYSWRINANGISRNKV